MADITYDAPTVSSSTAPADPFDFAHTGGGATAKLVVKIGSRGGDPSLTTVTYNGVALTKVRTDGPNSAGQTEMWYLDGPASGSNTVSVNTDIAIGTISVQAYNMYNATAGGPEAQNGTSGTVSPFSIDVTTVTDRCLVDDVIGIRGNPSTVTQGAEAGRTDWATDWEYEPGGNEAAIGGTKYENATPAGAKTFSWSFTGTGGAMSAAAWAPAPTAPFPPWPWRRIRLRS